MGKVQKTIFKKRRYLFQIGALYVLTVLLIFGYTTVTEAGTIYVGPGEAFTTIQPAIDAANNGDTIIVRDGTYSGDGNKNLSLRNKILTVKSANGPEKCIIDCELNGLGIIIYDQVVPEPVVIEGFTIKNSYAEGIKCLQSSLILNNCIVIDNTYSGIDINLSPSKILPNTHITNCIINNNLSKGICGHGLTNNTALVIENCTIKENSSGGISVTGGSPVINNCVITGNNSSGIACRNFTSTITNCIISDNKSSAGGGIYCEQSSANITNCIICNNIAMYEGGGICSYRSSSPAIFNCTIGYNRAYSGCAISCNNLSSATVINSIIWGESSFNQIYVGFDSSIHFSYSDVLQPSGIYPGTMNINEDPLFVSAEQENYYLLKGSPCIDKGTSTNAPTEDREGIVRPRGAGIDMGAYEDIGADSCIPRASFKASQTLSSHPVTVKFDAGSSGGSNHPSADFLWDFGDGSKGNGLTISHSYSDYGFYSVSLTISTECGDHTITSYNLIKIKSFGEVGEGYSYTSIQDAIDDAIDGEIILVHDGTYTERINFNGKSISVRSKNGAAKSSIISNWDGDVVTFNNAEDNHSILDGFTIKHDSNRTGSGISCAYSSATIINCIITNNSSDWGGGIYARSTSLLIKNCTIKDNKAQYYAGGIYVVGPYWNDGGNSVNGPFFMISNCSITNNIAGYNNSLGDGGGIYSALNSCITNCIIKNNSAYVGGGILFLAQAKQKSKITNCTIINNSASNHTGGILWDVSDPDRHPIITNCILWNNTPKDIFGQTNTTITYCDIKDGYPGAGNFSEDPKFNPDYSIPSASPCVDKGKNIDWLYSDYRGSLRPINGRDDVNVNNNFDIGAFEYSRPNDDVIKAFQEVKLLGYTGFIGYYNQLQWKSTGPFPNNDERITLPSGSKIPYKVKLSLISEAGGRIDLAEVNVPTTPANQTPEGYTWNHPVRFGIEHKGRWKIRIEMADDPEQFTLSDDWITIKEAQTETWIIGKEVPPPEHADPTKQPEISEEEQFAFYWSTYTKKLYAVAPITTNVIWKDAGDIPIPVLGSNIWSENTQIHIASSPAVDLLPDGCTYQYIEKEYIAQNAVIDASNKFTASGEGHSVIIYFADSPQNSPPLFEVIRTISWNDHDFLVETPWEIGQAITDNGNDSTCGGGHVHFEKARYDAALHDRNSTTRTGPIIPINKDLPGTSEDDMVIVWYQKGISGACWPYKPVRYNCQWPENSDKLIIASQSGSGDLPANYTNLQVYHQPDPTLPGYNPNEEHALIIPGPPACVYALRNDLNTESTSEPYVLLKYKDASNNNQWTFKIYKVVAEEAPYFFSYTGTAGTLIQPPYPLSLLQICKESYYVIPDPWWEDYKGNLYARNAGTGILRFFYPMQENFFYDTDGDGVQDAQTGDCIPWLDRLPGGTPGTPIDITFTITWPENIPELSVGETLLEPKNGLPDIRHQCSVEIIYDQYAEEHQKGSSVRLIDPLRQLEVDLTNLPYDNIFTDLPFHLRTRITYDPQNKKLQLKGYYDDTQVGEPLLLPNILSEREKAQLLDLSADPVYRQAIEALYNLSLGQLAGQTKLVSVDKALTAGAAAGTGYVTLAFSGDEACGPNPISLSVMEVTCPLYKGEIKVIEPDNVLDERVTMRHNGDFGGEPDERTFQWLFSPSIDKPPTPSENPTDWPNQGWFDYTPEPPTGEGAVDITIGGSGLQTLNDKWVTCRYKGYDTCGQETWSPWTDPQLYEGWIKRVVRSLNLFEQRCKDFHETEVNTFESMIIQAGERYEGDVALVDDPDYLNSLGLIQLYETVLRRGSKLSIDGTPPVDDTAANNALLLAAGRIADLYMLVGNEAYADATDPTIGFGTEDGIYGTEAPSIFCFQNQLDSLLAEELALLRGRDDSYYSTDIRPIYNHLIWNYTSGQDGGEVAYNLNYNLKDYNEDERIDEYDARIMFPQGHGDAWGHYLSAIKGYYKLLINDHYTWVPRTESVLVAGLPVEVDYLDERKFARAAEARARCGAEIVNLTYREHYVEDPYGQWQGYKDTDPDRAWGLSEWASRAGQGVYLDWVVANALLPDVDPDPTHTGIEKIDRTTVLELPEVASRFSDIQSVLDEADAGLNPIGVAKDALPFDISPTEIDQGKTHFEQIYERAVYAMNNAIAVFINHANQHTQLLRRQQDTIEDFRNNVQDREADFNNRLIEIFGTPYPEDCSPSGAYQLGYDGPDIYHFTYTDTELDSIHNFTVHVGNYTINNEGAVTTQWQDIPFSISTNLSEFIKPATWTSTRSAPGELQMSLSELLQTKARFEEGEINYDNLLAQIEDQAGLLQAQYNLNASEIQILNTTLNQQESLNDAIMRARSRQQNFHTKGRTVMLAANAVAEGLPKMMGTIVGMAGGVIADWTSALRAATLTTATVTDEIMNRNADRESLAELDHQQAKEWVQGLSNIKLTTQRNEFAVKQQVAQITQLIRQEASLRLELYTLQENMQQAERRYLAALARGERLLEDRNRFRLQTASKIQDYRYKDMAFRIFRNDALQKYRAQFDMAAMYVYLAAKAYDYETALLDSHSLAGQAFLTDIVRQRTIGLIQNGQPLTGTGLADPMARLSQNFYVLKGQLGFNNPQIETNWFSLRKELFRITNELDALWTIGSDVLWRDALEECRVRDLWDIPEFKSYCAPFAQEEYGAQPALVIPFESNVTFGMNFFGWPLSGGDSYYAPENFATKVRSVGVWFSNYNSLGMAQTPRVYLIPVGADVLRIPYTYSLVTREWQVEDQILPLPFPLSGSQDWTTDRDWIPLFDTLYEDLFGIRRHSRFRAYHDSGVLNLNEMTYDSRLIGRSVWNTRWLLIIPSASLYWDPENPDEGIERFIHGPLIPGGNGARTEYGVSDIKIFFQTYAYQGGD